MSKIIDLLKTTQGMIAVVVVAGSIGGTVSLKLAGLAGADSVEEVANRVDQLEDDRQDYIRRVDDVLSVVEDSLGAARDQRIWIICTTVPPNRADVLAALRVRCDYDSPTQRTIRGVPLLSGEE